MTNQPTINPARPIITAKEIEEHFQDQTNVTWVPLKDLLENTPEQCVDGRCEQGIIGTPGGNMGEFVLCLSAAQNLIGQLLPTTKIFHIFEQYLSHFGRFYMHTDTHALDHLLHTLHKAPQFKSANLKTQNDLINLINNPPRDIQPILIEHLIDPNHIGCGHLKLMINHSSEYGSSKQLITAAMRAFFYQLWQNNSKLDFVVLDHNHQEGAVVVVTVKGKVAPDTKIPTVAPMAKGSQMFVVHPQAASFLRQSIAKDIVDNKLIQGIDKSNQTQYIDEINRLGGEWTRYTLSHLALGLPHYSVTF